MKSFFRKLAGYFGKKWSVMTFQNATEEEKMRERRRVTPAYVKGLSLYIAISIIGIIAIKEFWFLPLVAILILGWVIILFKFKNIYGYFP